MCAWVARPRPCKTQASDQPDCISSSACASTCTPRSNYAHCRTGCGDCTCVGSPPFTSEPSSSSFICSAGGRPSSTLLRPLGPPPFCCMMPLIMPARAPSAAQLLLLRPFGHLPLTSYRALAPPALHSRFSVKPQLAPAPSSAGDRGGSVGSAAVAHTIFSRWKANAESSIVSGDSKQAEAVPGPKPAPFAPVPRLQQAACDTRQCRNSQDLMNFQSHERPGATLKENIRGCGTQSLGMRIGGWHM